MCIQFAEHLSRGRIPNFQQVQFVHECMFMRTLSEHCGQLPKYRVFKILINDIYFLFWFQSDMPCLPRLIKEHKVISKMPLV